MDLKHIKRIVQLVEDSQVSHVSIENNGTKIEVKKELTTGIQTQQVVQAVPQPVQAPQTDASPQEVKAEAPKEDENLEHIQAQMVGTFYASPNPDAKPYVKVGDTIKKGQVICIIEAMKLFNEIESEIEGKVIKVLVDDANPVEFEQDLFLIDPS